MANVNEKSSIGEIDLVETDCPICRSGRYRKLFEIPDFIYSVAGSFQYVQCNDCRHLFMNPRPTKESLVACYPNSYAPYHLNESETRSPENSNLDSPSDGSGLDSEHKRSWVGRSWAQGSLVRRVFRKIPGLKPFLFWLGQDHGTTIPSVPEAGPRRLLEIGCADGWFLLQAESEGWQVDGIEMSAAAAEQARGRGLSVCSGTFEDQGLSPNSREAIVFWMVLEHVIDPITMLESVFATLCSGGRVAFSIPNGGTLERTIFRRWWLGYEPPRHLHVFTGRQIRTILTRIGFENIVVQHQSNTRFWFGSLAAWGMERYPNAKWPHRWMEYFRNEPPKVWRILMLVPNKLVSLLRCSGRITVSARKPE